MVEAMTDIKPDVVVTDLPDPAPSSPLEALEWLGGTVEEVVEGLRARGIKGLKGRASRCPLHNYLTMFGWDVSVAGSVMVDRPTGQRINGPRILDLFVGRFDSGAFPDLIAD